MKRVISLFNVVLLVSLLVACGAPAPTAEPEAAAVVEPPTPTTVPGLKDLIVESIEGWDEERPWVFEVPLDEQKLDIPGVVGAYVRAWQGGFGEAHVFWAAVYQFADSDGARVVYDSAIGELKGEVWREGEIENHREVVVSQSEGGLMLYLVRRGQYIVTAGSAVTEPDAAPPAPSLVANLAHDSDRLIDRHGDEVPFSGRTLPPSAEAMPEYLVSDTEPNRPTGTELARSGYGMHYHSLPSDRSSASQQTVRIPVQVDLFKEGTRRNGRITLTIEVGPAARTPGEQNKWQHTVHVYVVKLEDVEDDGDGFFRGDGDVVVGAYLILDFKSDGGQLYERHLTFKTGEIGDVDDSNSRQVEWAPNGHPVGPFVCTEILTSTAEVSLRQIDVAVVDNDGSDALDTAVAVLRIGASAAKLAGLEDEGRNAGELADSISDARRQRGPVQERGGGPGTVTPRSHYQEVMNLEKKDMIGSGQSRVDSFEPDDTIRQAKPISTRDPPQVHNLHVLGDHDYVSFEAEALFRYTIETVQLGSKIDTIIYLYNSQGTLLMSDDDGGEEDRASRIIWTAQSSGTYYVMIEDVGNDAAGNDTEYEVRVAACDVYEPDDTIEEAKPISTSGTPHQVHNLHVKEDHDYVSFQAQAGTSYTIETFNLGSDMDTVIHLYDRLGNELESDDDGAEEDLASRITWTATSSETYYVMIEDYEEDSAGATATYRIVVTAVTAPQGDQHEPDDTIGQASPIDTDGTRQAHTFHTSTGVDYVSFTAHQGVRYTIQTGNLRGECDTEIYLYSAGGGRLDYDDDGADELLASRIVWTAPSSGTYYIKVDEFGDLAGPEVSYEIWISR